MSDDQGDPILIRLDRIDASIAGVKQDVAGVKQDVAGVKQNVADVKQNVADVKQNVADVKQNVADVNERVTGVIQRIDGLQAEQELRFADLRELITRMNVTLGTTAAVLAQHLQDHQRGDAA